MLDTVTVYFYFSILLGFMRCPQPVWPGKNRQVSIKVDPKMISLAKWKIKTTLQKLPKNEGDFGKIIVATGFEKLSKGQ